MSGLALLAREAGFKVTGSDEKCYPPVSDLLKEKGIEWVEGYTDSHLALEADTVIVGNAMKRGIPVLEAVLEQGGHYTSGPQWLADNILHDYQVIAIAGTHGKTTTTSMLAWILHQAGLDPAFLIGGVARNFNSSACLGRGKYFVIEADEYDSAFFDKRPKFMHYRPRIAVLNNLEFDHADIYPDLESIKSQFHYLIRTVPSSGTLIMPAAHPALADVLSRGQYCHVEKTLVSGTDADWSALLLDDAGHSFAVYHHGKAVAEVNWSLIGKFNVENGLSAIAASFHAGVAPQTAALALKDYQPVKRRLELKSNLMGISVYDDFAHHPTAIASTIDALKTSKRQTRILVVMEFASYTMKTGNHSAQMTEALALCDKAFILRPTGFSLENETKHWPFDYALLNDTDEILMEVLNEAQEGDAILIMSNRGFDNIHQRIIEGIESRQEN